MRPAGAGERIGRQTLLGDGLAADLAGAVRAVLEASEGAIDFVEDLLGLRQLPLVPEERAGQGARPVEAGLVAVLDGGAGVVAGIAVAICRPAGRSGGLAPQVAVLHGPARYPTRPGATAIRRA